jgi:predicted metal-binding membrane protein
VLIAWGNSPYAQWLDHAEMDHIVAPVGVRLAVFTLGWALMIVAMMLPGTLLLLARSAPDQPLRLEQVGPVVLAYLSVWMLFGGFSYWGDGMLHEAVEHNPGMAGYIAPGILLLVGIYQLTPVKRFCLSRCRFEGAEGEFAAARPVPNGWVLGLQHGLYCLGSCWALMLLMFATGGVNLVWMLGLGLVMAIERVTRHGVLVAQVAGILLIAWWAASVL